MPMMKAREIKLTRQLEEIRKKKKLPTKASKGKKKDLVSSVLELHWNGARSRNTIDLSSSDQRWPQGSSGINLILYGFRQRIKIK